jgi:predicted transcriptional regulator
MVMIIPKIEKTTTTTTATRTRIKRSGGIRIKVSEDIEMRLEKVSQALGVPPSTLAAVAVGTWVAQQERALAMVENVSNGLIAQMGELLPQLLSQIPDSLPQGAAGDDS